MEYIFSHIYIFHVCFLFMVKSPKENNGISATNIDAKCGSVPSTATQALQGACYSTWYPVTSKS